MIRVQNILGCAIALATALSLTGATALAKTRGYVIPCNLDGVNPARHPGVFRNPDVAAKFGFVKGPDGKWEVIPNCHISS